jgi:hypothetical protein
MAGKKYHQLRRAGNDRPRSSATDVKAFIEVNLGDPQPLATVAECRCGAGHDQ